MMFDLIGEIRHIETIARGTGIRSLARLVRCYGLGNWRKMKGIAQIRTSDGSCQWAEIHWYEGHGVGQKELKIKTFLEM